MIARLSLEVFYTITRKLVGAFYVDQKKKDLLPSTLPSEHEQWGMCSGTSEKQDQWFQAFPLSVFECFSVSLTRNGGSGTYVVRLVRVVNNGFYWIDANTQNEGHGSGDKNLWMAICR